MTREERNELVLQNMKLVHHVAKHYAYRAKLHGLDYDDVVNEGTIGLIKAIDKYNPSFGCVLSTYAVPMIHGAIQLLFREYHRGPKFNRKVKQLRTRIVRENLEDEQYDRIAQELETSVNEVVAAMELIHGPYSFDKELPDWKGGSETVAFYDSVPDGIDFTDNVLLDTFISTLTKRNQFIFMKKLDGKSQQEIGQALGISQVQVSRLLGWIRMTFSEYLGRNVS